MFNNAIVIMSNHGVGGCIYANGDETLVYYWYINEQGKINLITIIEGEVNSD